MTDYRVDERHRDALAFYNQGEHAHAIAMLRDILDRDPNHANIMADLGVVLFQSGALDEAEVTLRAAIEVDPQAAGAHYNLGLLLKRIGDVEGAKESYRSAIQLEPQMAAAHNNLGNLHKEANQLDVAVECYEAAIHADPDYAPAHRNLADVKEALGDMEGARLGFEKAAALRGDAAAELRAAMVMPIIPASEDEIVSARERLSAGLAQLEQKNIAFENPVAEVGATNFHLSYHGLDNRPLLERVAALYLKACPDLDWQAPGAIDRTPGKRIRVGFVSAFFRDHTIGRLYAGLIAGLPRNRFEVCVYAIGEQKGRLASEIQTSADIYRVIPDDLSVARTTIAADKLDILYFTDVGMEPVSYFLAFARLAPVQCVGWGHPETTGIPNADFFMSYEGMESGEAKSHYSEALVQLPVLPACPQPLERREGLVGAQNGRVYLCPQSLFKFHPSFDGLLGRILTEDHAANIILLEGSYPQWTARLAARLNGSLGSLAERISFQPRMAREQFLMLLASADVVLDTTHYSGGLTTFEALSMGTPVVTLPAKFMRSRTSLGYYRQMGLDRYVARDEDHYVDLAVASATNGKAGEDEIADALPALTDRPKIIAAFAEGFERLVNRT